MVLGFWQNDILIWDTLGRINENNTGTFKTKKKRKFNNILDPPPSLPTIGMHILQVSPIFFPNHGLFFSLKYFCIAYFTRILTLTVASKWLNTLRGGVKIENRENLGQCPNRGGGQKCPNFNFGILKTEWGVSIFQKCPNFNHLTV